MLVLNVTAREMEMIKGSLEVSRDVAYEYMTNEEASESDKDYYHSEFKTFERVVEEEMDSDVVRKGEFVERLLSMIWDQYLEYECLTDELEEIVEDMDMTEEEFIKMFKKLGYEK